MRREIDYEPLPSQAKFHESAARFKGFSGPVGSGKSQALCHEAIRLSYENPGRLGVLGAPTFPMLRDATMRLLVEILEANEIPYELNKSEHYLEMGDTGSRILFRPMEEFERLRGTNLAWFGLDELTYTSEEAWVRLEARLRDPQAKRLCGFGVWTPKGRDWVWRRFVQNKPKGYDVVLAEPFENRHLLASTPDFYERLEESYDKRFFDQEVLGRYVEDERGLVYREFRRAEHVKPCVEKPGEPLLWSLDFNVNPLSSVVAQRQGGMLRVLDEIVLKGARTVDACAAFVERYGERGGEVVVYGDASGYSERTVGASDYEQLQKYFLERGFNGVQIKVERKNPAVRERVDLMNSRLKNAAGEIRIEIDPRCRELIRDFEEVRYVEGSLAIDKESDPRRTHLSDALGYLVYEEFHERKTAGERGERLI